MNEEYNTENGIYYKLYNCKNGYVTIACLQWFDELDYNEKKFVRKNEEVLSFITEEKAISYLNENFNKEDIDPEYYRAKEKSNRLKQKLEDIYTFFLHTDDIHIDNEDDNYSYQSDEYAKNLENLKLVINQLKEL